MRICLSENVANCVRLLMMTISIGKLSVGLAVVVTYIADSSAALISKTRSTRSCNARSSSLLRLGYSASSSAPVAASRGGAVAASSTTTSCSFASCIMASLSAWFYRLTSLKTGYDLDRLGEQLASLALSYAFLREWL